MLIHLGKKRKTNYSMKFHSLHFIEKKLLFHVQNWKEMLKIYTWFKAENEPAIQIQIQTFCECDKIILNFLNSINKNIR